MEESGNLDEEPNPLVVLTDEQLTLLDSLPIYDDTGCSVHIANMVGLYTKVVYPKFTGVNFTRLDARGFAMSTLALFYVPSEKKCKFLSGDIAQLDKFLADAAFVN